MRKYCLFIMLVLCLAVTGCSGSAKSAETADPEQNTGIANPWIDCATLADAEKIAGFDIMVPDRIEGYPETFIQAVDKDMIQVFYYDSAQSEEERSRVLLRKGVGDEDITGDYNEYSQTESAEIHGVNVDLRGNDGLIYDALWTQGGYSYAILADDGLTRELIEDLVELIK